jgi:hypothetical protein
MKFQYTVLVYKLEARDSISRGERGPMDLKRLRTPDLRLVGFPDQPRVPTVKSALLSVQTVTS